MKKVILVAVLTLVLAACGRRDISGDYVATPLGMAYLLQITETPDGHIQGTWERTQTENGGMLTTNHFAVTGTTDGRSITLSATATNVYKVVLNITRSGTVNGDTISLASPYRSVEYRRGTPDEYYLAYRKLVAQSGKRAMENYQRQQAMLRAEKNANGSH